MDIKKEKKVFSINLTMYKLFSTSGNSSFVIHPFGER